MAVFSCLAGLAKVSPYLASRTRVALGILAISMATFARVDAEIVYENSAQSLLEQYCLRCHGPEKQKGSIRFDELNSSALSVESLENLEFALDALITREMPPEEADPLPDGDRERLLSWIELKLEEAAEQRRESGDVVRLRRLSHREYEHTLQDLFGAEASFARRLPPDPISEKGYDNAPELLMVSHVDLQLYLDAARVALERYLHFGEIEDRVERFAFEAEDIYHYCRNRLPQLMSEQRAPKPLSEKELQSWLNSRKKASVVYRDRKYGPLPYGHIPTGDVPKVGEGRGFARLHEQFMLLATRRRVGEVVVRVHAAAIPGADGSHPRMRLEAGRRIDRALKALTVGEADVTHSLEEPGMYEFRFRLEDAMPLYPGSKEDLEMEHLLLNVSNVARHEAGELAGSEFGHADLSLLDEEEMRGATAKQTVIAREHGDEAMARMEAAKTNFLKLDAIEAEIIPLSADVATKWRVPLPATPKVEPRVVRNTLRRFLPEAFRRPVSHSELSSYIDLYEGFRTSGESFKEAVKGTLASALISPSFLFIGYPDAEETRYAEDVAFASRLSYLVWSSMPDQRLLDLAASGRLRNPRLLERETRRMLNDPKARRFSASFAWQWLGLRKLQDVSVDRETYPDYGDEFQNLIKQQSVATFQDVFHGDRDSRELFSSKHMILNNQLARHYGVSPIEGGDLRRVKITDTKNWGGILTHASMLAMNSDGKESHPVKRGVWLLEKLLNDPPPPPPPVVPELDAENPQFAELSLKQKIEQHREMHGCTDCHEKIDPWGIAFEEFDATGRWRDPASYTRPIDASTILPDGSKIADAKELSSYLLTNREEELMSSIVEHMMTYALGRDLDIVDKREVEEILDKYKLSGYNLKSLVVAIAQSDAFTIDRNKVREQPSA